MTGGGCKKRVGSVVADEKGDREKRNEVGDVATEGTR